MPRLRWTKSMTSPLAPQPKQWNRSGTPSTDREGVVSSWNGQQPTHPLARADGLDVDRLALDAHSCASRTELVETGESGAAGSVPGSVRAAARAALWEDTSRAKSSIGRWMSVSSAWA